MCVNLSLFVKLGQAMSRNSDRSDIKVMSNINTTQKSDEPISDSVDRPSVLHSTASYIIVTEFCERLAYYGTLA